MPVEIGYVPPGATVAAEPGVEIPDGLPASTIDLLVAAPKTVSVLYAALTVEGRTEQADQVVAAHHAGVDAAISMLNARASSALVYRGGRRQTSRSRLAKMLEREPDAPPERRDDLAALTRDELRDPMVVERVESTGLRINQLFHDSHNGGRGDPHLHTHLFVDADVTALDEGHDYPRDQSTLLSAVVPVVHRYDAGASQALAAQLGTEFRLNERTGRQEIAGITDDLVASFTGTKCVPESRFHQVVIAHFVGYSL